ncbi:uncharacterized protein [Parasteatoda tepidariorum]|uniref:uncharacterized protein n=1 Tax=Parasteatoda tepidariorum TaxID=114398 RepID=UPI00077FAFAA|nr:uncharacterized protein LOC107448799 [Parasteatoda tepidariorum]
MTYLNFAIWIYALLLWNVVYSDDALKNHRLEKRQDDSFLFFGGWRPVRSGASYYHGSPTGRYHDILSALPTSFDATSRYYSHALPSTYHKDIYSYYPRPAIKTTPKKNIPVYMERLRPQKPKQQQNYGGGGGSGGYGPQIIDLPQIDLKQIQNLHDLIQRAKDIPIPNLNIPFESGKPVELVELSVHPFSQGGQSYGGKSSQGYSRHRNSQNRGRKSNYGRIPQSRIPYQPSLHYELISLPKSSPIIPQIIPKEISVGQIAPILPSVGDVLNLKNIQVVEVPVPSGLYGGKNSHSTPYRAASLPQPVQYASSPKNVEIGYPDLAQYAYQTEQHSKSSGGHKPKSVASEPVIEAELIKLSEEDLKDLLPNLHVLDKVPHDLLKYLQIGDLDKIKDAIQHIIAPQEGHGQVSSSNYQSAGSYSQSDGYSEEDKYGGVSAHSPKGTETYKLKSGGYQISEEVGNQVEHNAAGYEIENSKSSGGYYEQSDYQNGDGRSAVYEQQGGYDDNAYQHQSSSYQTSSQEYSKDGGNQEGQKFIQVVSPPDKNGYRREPVLAVEIQHGQTIEEAIKSLDHETLKKLGAHGKNGLEIEVVEVPVDEYAQESKKRETVVSSKNSTLIFKKKVLDKKS